MITVEIIINKNIDNVWDYFTKPENWKKWYGGGLKKVEPGWETGARMHWELGGSSPIDKLVPKELIRLSGAWMDTSYIFSSPNSDTTKIIIETTSPKGGATFNDGGAAHKKSMMENLQKLKANIESE